MVPLNIIRAVLGLLTIFFAHFLGRALVYSFERRSPRVRLGPWLIRFALALGAIIWSGGLDTTAVVTLVLATAAGGYGAWRQARPQKTEDLVRQMFPEEPGDRPPPQGS